MEFEIQPDKIKNCSYTSEDPVADSIPILQGNNLSYSDFFTNYMSKNKPCLITNIGHDWDATAMWVTSNGKPNIEYLNEKYCDTKVIVYNCSERYFNSQKCFECTLGDYSKLWDQGTDETIYYLKDWHLKLQCQNDNFYEVPIFFASDWLNEYFIQCTEDDYRFVYVGKKGSWTPLHADVFDSFSWSVNICGKKRWIFFPPGEENNLKDNLNNLPYDINNISVKKNCLELIQHPGEAVFVPSGWYHQVWNLEDTISINHNWINGCNILAMWHSLKNCLKLTQREIDDCRDMDNFDEHCQTILQVHFGMDYNRFFAFLKFIAKSRMNMLNNNGERTMFHKHKIGFGHILFDFSQISSVLEDFVKCDNKNCKEGLILLSDIKDCMRKYI